LMSNVRGEVWNRGRSEFRRKKCPWGAHAARGKCRSPIPEKIGEEKTKQGDNIGGLAEK